MIAEADSNNKSNALPGNILPGGALLFSVCMLSVFAVKLFLHRGDKRDFEAVLGTGEAGFDAGPNGLGAFFEPGLSLIHI